MTNLVVIVKYVDDRLSFVHLMDDKEQAQAGFQNVLRELEELDHCKVTYKDDDTLQFTSDTVNTVNIRLEIQEMDLAAYLKMIQPVREIGEFFR